MNSYPEHEPDNPSGEEQAWPQAHVDAAVSPAGPPFPSPGAESSYPQEPSISEPRPVPVPEFLLNPPPPEETRIPHFGHLLFLLLVLAPMGLLATGLLMAGAVHVHMFGVQSLDAAKNEIHYILGSEAVLYFFTFAIALIIFPMFWHKNLFAGLQWNGATALRLSGRLVAAAFVCFVLALLNGELMPGPTNTPIEKVFRAPGAAWFLFGFGVTFAPFFEETLFRGFLLPALCTACDWVTEKTTGEPMLPLDENGHPQWSLSAMVVGSIATSVPFAWMHAAQTGYSLGPFLLLVGVSLVLCLVRLTTRSLASSVLVHACYNFLLFSLMLFGTGGFRHLDKI